MQHLALRVVRGMAVHADRMRANLELTCGALFSQRVLLALVERRAWRATTPTGSSSGWPSRRGTPGRRCATLLAAEPGLGLDLDAIFDYGHYTRHVPEIAGAPGGDPHRHDRHRSCMHADTGRARPTSSTRSRARSSTRSCTPSRRGRAAAVISVLDADKVRERGRRGHRPVAASAPTSCSARGVSRLRRSTSRSPARVPRARHRRSARAARASRSPCADPLRAGGVELDVDAERFAARRRRQDAPRSSPASAAPRRPPTRRWARRPSLHPRAAPGPDLRGRARGDDRRLRRARLRAAAPT